MHDNETYVAMIFELQTYCRMRQFQVRLLNMFNIMLVLFYTTNTILVIEVGNIPCLHKGFHEYVK